MSTIPVKKIKELKTLYYDKKYSMKKIADKFGVSIDAVVYAMRHHKLSRRSATEANAACFEMKPKSFLVKKRLSLKDEILKIIGVSLYWGEGYKAEKASGIDFANSDVNMILAFLSFLRRICGIDEKRMTVYLYCYSNQNLQKLINFWSKEMGIPKSKFSKPYVRNDFNLEKISKMPYGLVHIRYSDKKLLRLVKSWIEELKNEFCAGGRVVKYKSL